MGLRNASGKNQKKIGQHQAEIAENRKPFPPVRFLFHFNFEHQFSQQVATFLTRMRSGEYSICILLFEDQAAGNDESIYCARHGRYLQAVFEPERLDRRSFLNQRFSSVGQRRLTSVCHENILNSYIRFVVEECISHILLNMRTRQTARI